MRQHKFRVWDKENKKWIDDSDIAINQEGLLFIRYEGQVAFQPMSLTKSSNFEIVFFTGLKDKNGKEIYEGDIIRYGDGGTEERFQTRLVYFDKGSFVVNDDVYFNGNLSPIVLSCVVCNDEEYESNCEVIGNIYENPELLEAKK